jgi:hypothetical protein
MREEWNRAAAKLGVKVRMALDLLPRERGNIAREMEVENDIRQGMVAR